MALAPPAVTQANRRHLSSPLDRDHRESQRITPYVVVRIFRPGQAWRVGLGPGAESSLPARLTKLSGTQRTLAKLLGALFSSVQVGDDGVAHPRLQSSVAGNVFAVAGLSWSWVRWRSLGWTKLPRGPFGYFTSAVVAEFSGHYPSLISISAGRSDIQGPLAERRCVQLCHSGPEAELRAEALLLGVPESSLVYAS